MTIGTYAQLKDTIADFLLRDDLTAAIPTFIRLAEARIDRDLRHWRQEKRSVAQLDTQYSAIPADFLRPIRLQITDLPTGEVAPISTAQMLQLRGDRNDRVGRPTNYALTAGRLELYPTPDNTYNASLVYYGRIDALSDSNTTNWLLTEAPDAYLYGALIHSAPYLKDDPRITVWGTLYTVAIDTLNTTSEDAKFGGTGLVMKTKRGAP
jgi:hypothetical protein